MRNLINSLKEFVNDTKRYEDIKMMGLAIIVGIVTGIISIIYKKILEFFHYQMVNSVLQFLDSSTKLKFFLLPILGGISVGIINRYFISKENSGFGVFVVIEELEKINKLVMKPELVVTKIIGTIITLGSGLSAGGQGPIVYLGGAIGSNIGYGFDFDKRKIRILIGCGVAGSLGGVFNIPIAATIFVLEVMMHKEHLEYFTPIIISSITSVLVIRSLLGEKAFLQINGFFGTVNYKELVFYLILGIVIGLVSVLYIISINYMKSNFSKLSISIIFYPIIGAFIVAIIGYFVPLIFDIKYGTINMIIMGNFSLKILLILLVGKFLATIVTLGSGCIGGVFLPGLFIGSATGSIFGNIMYLLFPKHIYNSSTYSLVAMGAMFAGFADAPITATLILLELTGNYSIIMPILISCVVSSAIRKIIYKDTIYTSDLRRRGIDVKL